MPTPTRPEWAPLPPLRARNDRLTPDVLADVDCHVPDPDYWRSSDRGNWCHEGTHGVNARVRNQYGRPGVYLGGSRCLLLTHPATTIRRIAALVPAAFRGFQYQTYCVGQAGSWDAEPLYLWDEWAAYVNGARCDRMRQGTLAEYLPCALAVPLAADLDGPTGAALGVLLPASLALADPAHPYLRQLRSGEAGWPYRESLARHGLTLGG